MSQFDPYLNWLGIPAHEQPPNFYRLLGIVLFESDPKVIEQAADRQSLAVGAYQGSPNGEMCQRLLGEIAMARFNLLDPQQKAGYDAWLQQSLASRGERAVAAPPPPSMAGTFLPTPLLPPFAQPMPLTHMPMSPVPTVPSAPVFPVQPLPPAPMQLPQGPMPVPQATMPPSFMPLPMPQPPSAGGPQSMTPPAFFRGPMPASPTMPGPAPMPASATRLSVPAAAPFPVASRAGGNGAAVPVPAPPAIPPAAPLRPLEEIEQLAAQPNSRRRLLKKKHKSGYGKEIVIGVVVASAAVLLIVIYLAARGPSRTGLGGIADDGGRSALPVPASTNAISEKAKPERERKSTKEGPLQKATGTVPAPRKRPASNDEGDYVIRNSVVPRPAPPPNRRDIDSPQDPGGPNDPVMGTPDNP